MVDTPETDALVERLHTLIDQATALVRKGDGDAALLLIKECLTTAEKLPQKTERLPPLILRNPMAECRVQSNESDMSGACMRCGAKPGEPCPEGRR